MERHCGQVSALTVLAWGIPFAGSSACFRRADSGFTVIANQRRKHATQRPQLCSCLFRLKSLHGSSLFCISHLDNRVAGWLFLFLVRPVTGLLAAEPMVGSFVLPAQSLAKPAFLRPPVNPLPLP